MQTSTTADFYIKCWLSAPAESADVANACAISEDEVHVWAVNLARIPVMEESFSREEQQRVAKFALQEDQQRFKAAHSALRMVLARYLKLAPSALLFGRTEFGKPFLINSEANGLLFNLSYSGDVALVAVTRDREVGIDVASVRQDSVALENAEQFFSVAEIYTLSGLKSAVRTRAFFNCWTRKQAYLKARGEGVSIPLDQFDVSLAPDVPATMLSNRIDGDETSRWMFQDLQLAAGYAGAVVFESLRSQPQLSYFAISL